MKRTTFSTGRIFVGRLPLGVDLLESISRIANEEEIGVGRIEVYGSVGDLSLTVHNQETRFPESIREKGGFDIVMLGGTISQFKRRALPGLSGLFIGSDLRHHAGRLALGTTVHACEIVLTEFTGGSLSRDFDMETGLPLWKRNSLLIEEEGKNEGGDGEGES